MRSRFSSSPRRRSARIPVLLPDYGAVAASTRFIRQWYIPVFSPKPSARPLSGAGYLLGH